MKYSHFPISWLVYTSPYCELPLGIWDFSVTLSVDVLWPDTSVAEVSRWADAYSWAWYPDPAPSTLQLLQENNSPAQPTTDRCIFLTIPWAGRSMLKLPAAGVSGERPIANGLMVSSVCLLQDGRLGQQAEACCSKDTEPVRRAPSLWADGPTNHATSSHPHLGS